MNRYASTLFLLLALPMTVCADDTAKYDEETLARAVALEAELETLVAREFAGSLPLSARVPVGDTRMGAGLLGGNLPATLLYINYLHHKGFERTSFRFSYPIFSDEMLKVAEYRYVFREMAKAAHNDGHMVTVIVGAHRLDNNYYLGFPDFDVCDDIVDRAVETATYAQRALRPDWLLIDLSPTTLGTSPGCEASIDNAGTLTLEVVDKIRDKVANLGVIVNLEDDDAYLDQMSVSDADLIAFATNDSVFAGPKDLLDQLQRSSDRVRNRDDNKKVAISQFWLTKLDPSDGGIENVHGTPVASDAADVWARVDRLLGSLARQLEALGGYEFVSIYEPDFVLGFHVELARLKAFDRSNGFDRFANMPIADRLTSRNVARRSIADNARALERDRTVEQEGETKADTSTGGE